MFKIDSAVLDHINKLKTSCIDLVLEWPPRETQRDIAFDPKQAENHECPYPEYGFKAMNRCVICSMVTVALYYFSHGSQT
jgi:hypothetical protein